jgi:hypothetical protein
MIGAEAGLRNEVVLPGEETVLEPARNWLNAKRAAVAAVILPTVVACADGGYNHGAAVNGNTPKPKIEIQKLGEPDPPVAPVEPGLRVPALVCKGFIAYDENRIVRNPILEAVADENGGPAKPANLTPMTVKRTATTIDIDPSPITEKLYYFRSDGTPLTDGQEPHCSAMFLNIAQVKVTLPNPESETDPFATTYHLFPEANLDGKIYNIDPGKTDCRALNNLAHIQYDYINPDTLPDMLKQKLSCDQPVVK